LPCVCFESGLDDSGDNTVDGFFKIDGGDAGGLKTRDGYG